MKYPYDSYIEIEKRKKTRDMHGCLQFILFFLLMAIVIAIIAWSQSGIEY